MASAAKNLNTTVAKVAAKSARSDVHGLVVKADDAKRFLLTVAYPVFKPDVSVAADGHIDVASDEVVERACWNFMRKGARLGIGHEPGHEDVGEVVENYIWRGEPWVLKAADNTEQVIMPGDWLVGMVLRDEGWTLYKSGLLGGVSVQGGAQRRTPSPATLDRVRSRIHG